MIIHNPILTGSFTVNGTDVSSITSSAASITALNSYTASQNILNGTYTLTSSFAAQTASFTAFTSSVNSFTASQLVLNGTYATTGSNTFTGIQTVNSNLVVTGSITAQTLVVQTVTSSVVYSSGSNVFGNNIANTQVFTGSMNLTGSLTVTTTGTELQVNASGVKFGNVIGDAHSITGSVGISGSLSGSSATFSSTLNTKSDLQLEASNSTNKWSLYTYTDDSFRMNYNGVGNDELIIASTGAATFSSSVLANGLYANAGNSARFYRSANDYYWGINNDSNNYLNFGTFAANGTAYGTNPKMILLDNGNVGIGTSSPTDFGSTYTTLCIDNATNGGVLDLRRNGVRGLTIAVDNSEPRIEARVSGQPLVFYTNNGGTVAPRLTIASTGAATFSSANQALGGSYSTTGNVLISTTDSFAINKGGSLSLGGKYNTAGTPIETFARIHGKKEDATDGSTAGYLAFETVPEATALLTERMRITSDAKVLMGTTTYGGVGNSFDNGGGIIVNYSGTGFRTAVEFKNNNGTIGTITCNGSATAYNTSSDYRLKQDLKDYEGLSLISKIKTYDYEWKSDNTRSYGVMAHELQEIIPQAVVGEKDGEKMQGVDYSKIVPVLIKAIQELQAQINELKNK